MKYFLFAFFLIPVFLSAPAYPQTMPVLTAGKVLAVTRDKGQLVIKTTNAYARVSVYLPSVIRVNISRDISIPDTSFAVIREPSDIRYTENDSSILVNTAKLRLIISKSPLNFQFYTADGKELGGDDQHLATCWQNTRVTNFRKLYRDERFIGLGEKTGNLDRRGQTYVNWNTDAGNNGPATDPLYETFPFYIGIHDGLTYGLFLDNPCRTWFNFGASTDNEMTWVSAETGNMNYYFFGAQGVADIIKDYTWLTGRMEMPPLWSLGYQQCRYSYGSAAEVLDIAGTFRKRGIPADVIYTDIDYMEGYKIFTWNKTAFPEPKTMIDTLKAMNFHLVSIVDPGIKIEKGYRQYDEGVANSYFAAYPDGRPYAGEAWPGRIHFPDFTDKSVREWWGRSFIALTEPGVEGFWNDMNEPSSWGQDIPSVIQFGKYSMPEIRNVYGMQMAKATFDGTKKLLAGKRPFVLTRAAYSGIQRYSAVWTGDNAPYDEHMLLGQRLVNSLGLSGVAFAGVDIGGFSGNVSPDLMVRWNSLGIYTPLFRNHASIETDHREPWRWGDINEKIIKKDIEERYRLLPYIYSAFYHAYKTGMPVSRSLAIDFTFDKSVYNPLYQNEFLFGDNILVAPVVSTSNTADVYLPAGNWYRKGTDSVFQGNKVYKVPAPLTDLPVFIRAGGIVTQQHVTRNTAEKGDGILELHIWNGKTGSEFTYYEDDGTSYNHERGEYYLRSVRFDPDSRTITLSPVTGKYVSKYKQLSLVLHGFGGIRQIKVNGRKYLQGSQLLIVNSRDRVAIRY